ncbi:hypothetical protein DFP77_12416 [Marinomonas foliarum]|jgi:hypothetical protein|uniref:Uncharacterized protein n=1 Tax=Marinomonas foliarum TaxID=491950 RepID=A0A368ZVW9_9GAMM|nr:hypothetical protein DFP77_12416 [Marinomonas foliarum]
MRLRLFLYFDRGKHNLRYVAMNLLPYFLLRIKQKGGLAISLLLEEKAYTNDVIEFHKAGL